MALVRLGGGVIGISGSIAGNTFARNRFGTYNRARTKPINPKSPRQSAARILIMMLAEQWREAPMTDEIREAWQTYAKSVNWNNRLGEPVKLTGFNMFIRSNAARITAGGDIVTDAPTDLGLPAGDPKFEIAANATSKQIVVTFDDTMDWCTEAGAYLEIEMGSPQNETRNFFGGPWRFAAGIAGVYPGGIASPVEIDPSFTLIPGQKIWCRAKVIRADARCSTPFQAPPVIVAGALYKLSVTGTLDPVINGSYVAKGLLGGEPYYEKVGGGWFIWFNDDDEFLHISSVLGGLGTLGYWTKETAGVVGAYTPTAPATGTATVADIS